MKIIKGILQKAGVLLALNIAYLMFMSGCFLLPVEPIIKNVETSLEIWIKIKEIDIVDKPMFDKRDSLYWDTFSDMIWANMATVSGGEPIVEAVRLDRYRSSTGEHPFDDLVAAIYYRDSPTLQAYSRYWNLNVGFLKILFSFMELSDIRFLLYWITTILSIFLSYRVSISQGWKGMIPLIASFMMTSLGLHSICVSFFGDIVIMLIFMLLLTFKSHRDQEEIDRRSMLFMIMGSITFAFGPLVAPVMTVGMCLVLWIRLQKEDLDKKILWVQIVLNTIWWILGYGVTMVFKQVLSTIVMGKQDGIDEAFVWFGLEMGLGERLSVLKGNLIRCFTPGIVKIPVLMLFMGILFLSILRHRHKSKKAFPIAFIALYPFFWVMIVSRHSIHSFTSNIFVVTFYAVFSIMMDHIHRESGTGIRKEQEPGTSQEERAIR